MEPLGPRSLEPSLHELVKNWISPDIAACNNFVSTFNESKKSVTTLYQINGESKEFRLYKLDYRFPLCADVDVDSTNITVHIHAPFEPSLFDPKYEGPIKRIETDRVVLKNGSWYSDLLPILKKLGEYCERIANEVKSHSQSQVRMLTGRDSNYMKWNFDRMPQCWTVCSPTELLAEDLRKELEKSKKSNSNV